MNVLIRKYDPIRDYEPLMAIIKREGEEWSDYLKPNYKIALEASMTYVAESDGELCGFSRSISDSGIYIWVIDLLVDNSFRGHSIGRKLMECLLADFPNQEAYVMSDVDEYYQKLGYKREGSIFQVK